MSVGHMLHWMVAVLTLDIVAALPDRRCSMGPRQRSRGPEFGFHGLNRFTSSSRRPPLVLLLLPACFWNWHLLLWPCIAARVLKVRG